MRVLEYTGQDGRRGKELMGTGGPEEVSRGTRKALESALSNRCIRPYIQYAASIL